MGKQFDGKKSDSQKKSAINEKSLPSGHAIQYHGTQLTQSYSSSQIRRTKGLSMKQVFKAAVVVMLLSLTVTDTSSGATTQIELTGTITGSTGTTPTTTPVVLIYTYNDALPPSSTFNAGMGATYPGAILDSLSIGSNSYAGTPTKQVVLDFTTEDTYSAAWILTTGPSELGFAPGDLSIEFSDTTDNFSGTGLPSFSELTALSAKTGILSFGDGDPRFTPTLHITFTSMAVHDPTAVVPLPAAAWMGMSLLGGLGVAKRLRRTQA